MNDALAIVDGIPVDAQLTTEESIIVTQTKNLALCSGRYIQKGSSGNEYYLDIKYTFVDGKVTASVKYTNFSGALESVANVEAFTKNSSQYRDGFLYEIRVKTKPGYNVKEFTFYVGTNKAQCVTWGYDLTR